MKKIIFLFILFILFTSSYGQIKYDKGYFINNNNQRIECFIKNTDTRYTSNTFQFKINSNDLPQKKGIESVKEYGIYDNVKFIRFIVNIDISSNKIDKLNYDKSPKWSQKQLFLKVLVEGKAKLYYYEEEDLKRFFYSVSDTLAKQLIYKKYLIEGGNTDINSKFRQQLWLDVKNPAVNMKSMEYLKYEENDLVKYFVAYNKYAGNSFIANTNYTRKEVINLKITPGLSNTSLSVINSYYNQLASLSYLYFKFNSKINYRIGLELEYIFPFNKNKWGFVIEPTYQNFNASTQNSNKVATIKFNSLEFPIGLRHYFHLNENYKIFLNGYFISNLSLKFNSSINFNFQSPFKITTGNSFAIGGGAYFKKISAEVRYYTKRELLFEYGYWTTDYHRFALLLGYRFL